MIHHMNLYDSPFKMIKSGKKTIELRLNDEKRSRIAIDEYIIFTNSTNKNNRLIVQVTALYKFDNFHQLYKKLPLYKCGYRKDEIATAHPNDMMIYYSTEQQKNYGVIGIELNVVNAKETIHVIDMKEIHYEQKGYVHYHAWNETYTGLMKQQYLDKRALERCILIAKQYLIIQL